MASRKKIGLLFALDDTWTGGVYYIFNIINALKKLPVAEMPALCIFYHDVNVTKKIAALEYPFLSFASIIKKPSLLERILVKCKRILFRQAFKFESQYPESMVDFLFPCESGEYDSRGSLKKIRKIFWIPDFQHKHLPHFFSDEEIEARNETFRLIASKKERLVLSSGDAKNDFKKFYPEHQNDVRVIPFATVLPPFDHLNIHLLLEKYGITQPYFMSPNQFWVHKNHKVILEAVLLSKSTDLNYQIVFTGKEHDYRHPGYTEALKKFVRENSMEKYVKFLGFIDRLDQLQLMNHALAVIQPSLFEGWSTVIEDGKAMDQVLIVSDLKVHREQCQENAYYFIPHDPSELLNLIKCLLKNKIDRPAFNYERRIVTYARQFIQL